MMREVAELIRFGQFLSVKLTERMSGMIVPTRESSLTQLAPMLGTPMEETPPEVTVMVSMPTVTAPILAPV